MSASIVDRLALFMKHKVLNQAALASILGYSSSEKISRLFRSDSAKPSADIIEDISKKFENELNIRWWLTGSGEMLLSDEPTKKDTILLSKSRKTKDDYTDVEILDVKAAANYRSGYITDGPIESIGKITIPTFLIGYRTHLIFQNSGDSMQPTVYDSDYLIASKVDPSEWKHITDNYIYVIVTQSKGVNIKRIKKSSEGKKLFYRCKSDNRFHRPFNIYMDDVIELWKVTCKLSFNLPNENEKLYNKVDDLELRFDRLEQLLNDKL